VFTALPSGEAVIPSQSARGEASRTSSSSTTRIFGNPYLQQQQQAQRGATPQATRAIGKAPGPEDATATLSYGSQGQRASEEAPGKAPGPENATATLSYGSQGQRAGEEAPTRTPARGSATVSPARPPPPSASTTQVFGAVSVPQASAPGPATTQVFGAVTPAGTPALPPAPSASTTQVFGAASVPSAPPRSAVGTSTQVFGAAAATPTPPATPSASTTQVFGAASVPGARPPPPAPSASTTQVFGAVSLPETKPPSPATTQVFGAGAIAGAAPKASATTTQVFGADSIRAAQKSPERTGAAAGSQSGPVPWPQTGEHPTAPRVTTHERRAVGASSGPIALPPDSPPAPPSPTPVPLPPQASASRPMTGSISAPISLPPEPLPERGGATGSSRRLSAFEHPSDVFDRLDRPGAEARPQAGAGKERLLVVLAAVLVLGLTIWLTYPMWRSRGAGLPAEALRAKEEAVALLRRDDEASREQAFARLRPLVAQFPKYTEAQAELGVALALKLDDVKVELELLGAQEARLREDIERLTAAQAPGDWESRVNSARAELENLSTQRQPLTLTVEEVTKELEASQRLIRTAPETEPASDVVARLKAQAVQAGVTGSTNALGLAERLRKVENPPHWSAITLAEYGLNAPSPPISLAEYSQALQALRERDKTFIRAYVLGARLALRQEDPAAARTLLETVDALNPHHTLARKLHALAASAAAAP